MGQYGLVSLATYPISTVSVIDVSSESTRTCLCGMKAPDGVSCLFKKFYHVLLRLPVGISSNVNSSRSSSSGVSQSSQLPLMAQEGLDKGSLADLRSS